MGSGMFSRGTESHYRVDNSIVVLVRHFQRRMLHLPFLLHGRNQLSRENSQHIQVSIARVARVTLVTCEQPQRSGDERIEAESRR